MEEESDRQIHRQTDRPTHITKNKTIQHRLTVQHTNNITRDADRKQTSITIQL